jgi:ADP-ribose pyrophosphatase YjhB (NUDIX family)
MAEKFDTIIAGGNVIEIDNKFLLVQEKRSDSRGQWNLAMGRKEPDEDIIACAKREGKEETGYNIELNYLIGTYDFCLPSGQKVICHIFKSEIVGGQLAVPDDMLGAQWFSSEEIEELSKKSLILPFIKDIIRDYRAGKRSEIQTIL